MTATKGWPLEPVLDLPGVTPTAVVRALHISGDTYKRLTVDGLTDVQADRVAVRLGHHPATVWPDWVDAALGPLDRDYLHSGWRQAWLHSEVA